MVLGRDTVFFDYSTPERSTLFRRLPGNRWIADPIVVGNDEQQKQVGSGKSTRFVT
jgi:hypothetical protein